MVSYSNQPSIFVFAALNMFFAEPYFLPATKPQTKIPTKKLKKIRSIMV